MVQNEQKAFAKWINAKLRRQWDVSEWVNKCCKLCLGDGTRYILEMRTYVPVYLAFHLYASVSKSV